MTSEWLPRDDWDRGRAFGWRANLGQLYVKWEIRKLRCPRFHFMFEISLWPLLNLDLLWFGLTVARE